MSVLDRIDAIDSTAASKKVVAESVDKFNDKHLFCLDYYLSEYDIVENIASRLMNMFSTCLNVDDFFIAKYQGGEKHYTSGNMTFPKLWHVSVFFNYSYTSDADALKFFNRTFSQTNMLSPRSARSGILSPAAMCIIFKRIDINGEVVLYDVKSGGFSRIWGPFSFEDENCKKIVTHLLYLLRGQESEDYKLSEFEMGRIGWINHNWYDLMNHYRTREGYEYEYQFEHMMPEKEEKLKWKETMYGIQTGAYDIVVRCEKVVLKARSLRELALRILVMSAFIEETKVDDNPMFCESHAISLHTPLNAYSFCMNGAYYKERKRNITGNIRDMKVANDFVLHLYDTRRIGIDYDLSRFAGNIAKLVNSITLDEFRSFVQQRSSVNNFYKDIVI